MIAIDPGEQVSGFIEIHKLDGRLLVLGERRVIPNPDLLGMLPSLAHRPIAVEMVASYGLPVGAEVFHTVFWIGRFVQAHGGNSRLVYRKEVKMHLCGSMKAKDSNIRQALIDRFGSPGTKKAPGQLYGVTSHVWSALAVGIVALESSPAER